MIYNTFLKICLLLIVTASFMSCNNKRFDNKYQLVKAVKANIEEISVNDLKDKIAKQEEEFTLIDVRQKSEFKSGGIEGAVCIPRGVLEFKISDEPFWEEEFMYAPADTSQIIIYSQSGSTGILAVESLKSLGYLNVVNLNGGYKAFNLVIKRDKLM